MRSMIAIAVVLTLLAGRVQADSVTKEIKLFNGKDLTNFYTYLRDIGKDKDPKGVFTVKDGAIRISGEIWGALTTEKEFENYRLIAEYKWGDLTFAPRLNGVRDSGVLLHCVGKDGAAGKAWMESIECQVGEGITGDFICIGKNTKITVTAKQKGKEWFYDPKAEAKEFSRPQVYWFGHDPDFKDVKGFRGKNDVEKSVGDWNTLECVCAGDKITIILNGVVVNACTNCTLAKGKIQFQSEGAEIFFRRVDLLPLKK